MFLLLMLTAVQPGADCFSPVEYLLDKLEENEVYEVPFPEGYMFIIEEEDTLEFFFDIAIREDHQVTGQGDPNFAPVVDRFRVYSDGTILWFSPLPGMYIPWEDFLNGVTGL